MKFSAEIGCLAADFNKFGSSIEINDIPKRRARLNGLELVGTANQHKLAAPMAKLLDNTHQLSLTNHARFINDNDTAMAHGFICARISTGRALS